MPSHEEEGFGTNSTERLLVVLVEGNACQHWISEMALETMR